MTRRPARGRSFGRSIGLTALSWVIPIGLAAGPACAPAPPGDAYAAKVHAERTRKDEMFRSDRRESPIGPGEIDRFVPLSYFPVDESYAVPAELEPAGTRVTAQMPTSTGKLRPMSRIGTLRFTLKGRLLELAAFLEEGTDRLFVPFTDLTSGTETYQAGRYLNLDPTATGIYVVDFNAAYHPYCYYNPEYDCPFPPPENRLRVPVRAGERLRDADLSLAR